MGRGLCEVLTNPPEADKEEFLHNPQLCEVASGASDEAQQGQASRRRSEARGSLCGNPPKAEASESDRPCYMKLRLTLSHPLYNTLSINSFFASVYAFRLLEYFFSSSFFSFEYRRAIFLFLFKWSLKFI